MKTMQHTAFKQVESLLKRSLKGKVAITRALVIGFLMTGLVSLGGQVANAATAAPLAGITDTEGNTLNATFGRDSVGIGYGAVVNNGDVVLGTYASSTGTNGPDEKAYNVAIGNTAKVTGVAFGTAIGTGATVTGTSGISIGQGATSADNYAVAIGARAVTNYDGTIAIGSRSTATGPVAVALGGSTRSTDTRSTALGAVAWAIADRATAVGNSTLAAAANSVAVGSTAKVVANMTDGVSIGRGADVRLGANNVSIGAESADKVAQQVSDATVKVDDGGTFSYSGFAGTATGIVSVGNSTGERILETNDDGTIKNYTAVTTKERQIVNVAPGEISATSTDVINGSQLYAVAQRVERGWDIAGDDGTTVTYVNPTKKVSFKNGKLTTAVVEVDPVTGNPSVTYDVTTAAPTVNTTAGDANMGAVTKPDTNGGVTAEDLTNILTTGGWNTNAAGSNITDGANIDRAVIGFGKSVDFAAGKNMEVNRAADGDGNVTYTYATKKDVQFDKVTVGGTENLDGTYINNKGLTINKSTNPANNVVINGDQISMGGNRIENLGAGVADTDAVNVKQLHDEIGNAVNPLRDEMYDVGASAAALGALKPLQYDPLEPTQIMVGYGNYRGSSALAMGVAHYKNESTMFHAGMSWAGGSSHMMANAGITWKVGSRDSETAVGDRYRKGPISFAYAMQNEMAAMKAQNAGLKGEVADLKAENEQMKAENEQMKAQIAVMMAKLGL